MIEWIHLTRDRLQSARSINVSDRRNLNSSLRPDLIHHQHRWSWMSLFEVIRGSLFKYRWSEWSKRLSLFYAFIEYLFHVRASRIHNNRTVAQRARPKF